MIPNFGALITEAQVIGRLRLLYGLSMRENLIKTYGETRE